MKYTLVTTKVYLKIRKIKALICKGVRGGGVCVEILDASRKENAQDFLS